MCYKKENSVLVFIFPVIFKKLNSLEFFFAFTTIISYYKIMTNESVKMFFAPYLFLNSSIDFIV